MQKVLLLSLLFAFATSALAPASQAQQSKNAQAGNSDMQMSQSAGSQICSNGPVVADYGNTLEKLPNTPEANIAREVRHRLLMLPYYSLFDDLEYCVQGRTVTLTGSLTAIHSQTKPDAEATVKRIEGVEKVVNDIKVLSPNPMDQHAREAVYRKLQNSGGLSQYFWEAAPSIHIIVDNLHCTLKGYVNSEGDKNLAGIAAKEVRSLFSVTNDLQVVK